MATRKQRNRRKNGIRPPIKTRPAKVDPVPPRYWFSPPAPSKEVGYHWRNPNADKPPTTNTEKRSW
jgi:hypothetical protein